MLSQNEKESLTLEDAQDLQVCRAIRNVYTGAICTIIDRKIPTNDLESIVGDTFYEVRKTEDAHCPSFIISAPALFNLYYYALNEKGERYCIACFNYEQDNDEKLNKNEEETKMNKVIISELKEGQRLLVVKDGEIKGNAVKVGDIVSVKKVYKDGRKVSLYIMRKNGEKFVLDGDHLLTAVGVAVMDEFFSTDVDTATEEKIEKSVLKQEVLDMKVDTDKIGANKVKNIQAKNIELDASKYKNKYKKIDKLFKNENSKKGKIATIVLLADGTRGVAKCNLEYDEYDEYVGVSLAYARAIIRQENRDYKGFTKALSARYKVLNKIKKDIEFEHSEKIKFAEKTISEIIEGLQN